MTMEFPYGINTLLGMAVEKPDAFVDLYRMLHRNDTLGHSIVLWKNGCEKYREVLFLVLRQVQPVGAYVTTANNMNDNSIVYTIYGGPGCLLGEVETEFPLIEFADDSPCAATVLCKPAQTAIPVDADVAEYLVQFATQDPNDPEYTFSCSTVGKLAAQFKELLEM